MIKSSVFRIEGIGDTAPYLATVKTQKLPHNIFSVKSQRFFKFRAKFCVNRKWNKTKLFADQISRETAGCRVFKSPQPIHSISTESISAKVTIQY